MDTLYYIYQLLDFMGIILLAEIVGSGLALFAVIRYLILLYEK